MQPTPPVPFNQPRLRRPNIVGAAVIVLVLLGVMWSSEILDQLVLAEGLDDLGIVPRSETGLRGLLFAPFLHVGFEHLISNTLPFAVMALLIAARSVARFVAVTLGIMVGGGFAVWLVSPANTIHLGASLLVFGYLGYLIANGWHERSVGSVVIALGVLFVYGGLLWGVLPLVPGVSWQSHLFGFLAGALASRALSRVGRVRRTSRVPGTPRRRA